MKAIFVKYLGPTDTKTARLKAYEQDGNTLIVPAHRCDYDEYLSAALALVEKLEWGTGYKWVGGSMENGYVFVAGF
jgi:hypothetical protein